jgi:hypothetical protein
MVGNGDETYRSRRQGERMKESGSGRERARKRERGERESAVER